MSKFEDYTDAQIERSQSLLAAILGPMCAYCGTDIGLRVKCDGGGYIAPEYTCETCFTATDTGPCFDDLPEAMTMAPSPKASKPVAWLHRPTGHVVSDAQFKDNIARWGDLVARDTRNDFEPLYASPAGWAMTAEWENFAKLVEEWEGSKGALAAAIRRRAIAHPAPAPEWEPHTLPSRLRNARMMVNYGNGDVRDEPDPLHEEAADFIDSNMKRIGILEQHLSECKSRERGRYVAL